MSTFSIRNHEKDKMFLESWVICWNISWTHFFFFFSYNTLSATFQLIYSNIFQSSFFGWVIYSISIKSCYYLRIFSDFFVIKHNCSSILKTLIINIFQISCCFFSFSIQSKESIWKPLRLKLILWCLRRIKFTR